MKCIRIFLLILIVVGIWMIFARGKWVPKVVDYIIKYQDSKIKK